MTPEEAEHTKAAAFHDARHRFLHLSWLKYEAQFGVDLNEFVQPIDPLEDYRR